MSVDRARREEQLRCDFLVREAFTYEAGDLQLLRGELRKGRRITLVGCLAGGAQLGARPMRPGGGAKGSEDRECRPQLGAGIRTLALPAQVLAIEQTRPGRVVRPFVTREPQCL